MSFEVQNKEESYKPKFDIWLTADDAHITQKKLLASHADTTFEMLVNLSNYTIVEDIKMVSNERMKDPDELNRLREYARDALTKYLDDAKWEDYLENFQ